MNVCFGNTLYCVKREFKTNTHAVVREFGTMMGFRLFNFKKQLNLLSLKNALLFKKIRLYLPT